MKTPLVFTLLLGWSLALLSAREPSRNIEDLMNLERKVTDVAIKAMPATVALVAEELGSSGSGVIVSEDGLILTAAHVVQGAKEMTVVFPSGKQTEGKVLGANYSKDIAMVKIQEQGPWPFMEQGSSKNLEAGDWVVAMGHAAGYDAARTPPLRFGRVMSKGPGNYLTTDCKLIGGDSGGPLYDLQGRVVGINSSIGVSLKNNNHAGIDGFKADWSRLLAGESWGELQMNPLMNQERPVLGIGTSDVRGLGVGVTSVEKNSPAAKAGLRRYDIIKFVNNEKIRSGAELQEYLVKRQAGDKVRIGILRDDKSLELEAELVTVESLMKKK